MFSVSDKAWLNLEVVTKSPIGSAVAGEAPWVQLALYLIHAAETRDPVWGSYLAGFSRCGQKPVVLWQDEHLEALTGTQVLDTALDYRNFYKGKHAELHKNALQQAPAHLVQACTLPRFQEAAAAVRARLFRPFTDRDPCLVAGTELVQHGRRPNVQLQVKGGSLFDRAKTLQVVAVSSLATEEPLMIDYGPGKLESQVALDYGAYAEAYAQPGFLLTLSLPSEEDDNCYFDKLDILEQEKLGSNGTHTFVLRPDEAPSEELLAFLRLMNIRGLDSFLMEPIFRNEAWGHMCEPVSPENEEAVCRSMVDGCEAALASFPTTLGADIKELDALEERGPLFTALKIRMAEKRVLEAVAAWFSQRLSVLDKLEYYQERRLKKLGLLDDDGESTFEDMIKLNL